ncbi:hypothetical protein AC578_1043 [Pseudocercospora eumusae]|uniref:Uncharacterized protein n=1 Tax=Pseudocercospora eumusae TaxID=321146 RepID=A0A139HTG6_9PEZI|nr:hypothetical protein AC578_1043 [Pseudocercospora eumusae]
MPGSTVLKLSTALEDVAGKPLEDTSQCEVPKLHLSPCIADTMRLEETMRLSKVCEAVAGTSGEDIALDHTTFDHSSEMGMAALFVLFRSTPQEVTSGRQTRLRSSHVRKSGLNSLPRQSIGLSAAKASSNAMQDQRLRRKETDLCSFPICSTLRSITKNNNKSLLKIVAFTLRDGRRRQCNA